MGNNTGVTLNETTCTDLGSTIKVENLQHSAIRGTTTIPSSSSSSSSGGGSSGSSSTGSSLVNSTKEEVECTEKLDCPSDESCFKNECVKPFDVKIIDLTAKEGVIDITYFFKGMAKINNDVTIEFWLELGGEKLSSGTDVIYLGEFEEKTESTKIFMDKNLQGGNYDFYVRVSYDNYQATSHRTLQLDEKLTLISQNNNALVGKALESPQKISSDFSTFWIALIVFIGIFLIIEHLYFKRKIHCEEHPIKKTVMRTRHKRVTEPKETQERRMIKGLLKEVLSQKHHHQEIDLTKIPSAKKEVKDQDIVKGLLEAVMKKK